MAALLPLAPPLACTTAAVNHSRTPVHHHLQYAATAYFFAETPAPLPPTADPLLFSEGRVMRHLHRLADEIGHRQVGSRV